MGGRPDKSKQLVVLRAPTLRERRAARGLTLQGLARQAGVGYGSAARAVGGRAVGLDVAGRLVAVLGLTLAEATAGEGERRPPGGCSPEALQRFGEIFRPRMRGLIEECHRAIRAEAARRCWFWMTLPQLAESVIVRQATAAGEISLWGTQPEARSRSGLSS